MKKLFLLMSLMMLSTPALAVSKIFKGHSYDVHTVSFSKDGRFLASGSGDTRAIVWDIKKRKATFEINEHQRTVYAVAFSKTQNNILATSSSDGELIIWDTETQKPLATLMPGDIHGNGIVSLDFSPTSDLLAVGFMGGELGLWNTKTFENIGFAKEKHLGGFTLSVKFSRDGNLVFTTGGLDGSIFMHDTTTLDLKQTFVDRESSAPIWDISVHPGGDQIAAVTSAGALLIWKIGEDKPLQVIRVHDYLALSVEYSKDGSKVYVGVDAFNSKVGNNVKVIDSMSGVLIKDIKAHQDRIRGMDLSADGTMLATGSWDRTVKVWDVKP